MADAPIRRSRQAVEIDLGDGRHAIYSPITGSHALIPFPSHELPDRADDLDQATIQLLSQQMLIEPEDGPANSFARYRSKRDAFRYAEGAVEFVLHLTYDCNLRCPYCYENGLARDGRLSAENEASVLQFMARVLDDLAPDTVSVTFIGGEPTLECDLIGRVASFIREHCEAPSFLVVTNGTLVSDRLVETCRDNGVWSFQITVDGPQDVHDTLRIDESGGGSFDRVTAGVLALQKADPRFNITINCNLSAANAHSVPGLIEHLKQIAFAGDLIFSSVFGGSYTGFESTLAKEGSTWLESAIASDVAGWPHDALYRAAYMACAMYSPTTFIVGADGIIYSCFSGVGRPQYAIAHVDHYGSATYEASAALWLERWPFSRSCESCEFVSICNGNCTYLNDVAGFDCPRQSFLRNEVQLLRRQLTRSI